MRMTDKIKNYLKTIDGEVERLKKNTFWGRFFSTRIGRGITPDSAPVIFFSGFILSFSLLMACVQFGLIDLNIWFLGFFIGINVSIGIIMAIIGCMNGLYLKPGNDRGKVVATLNNLKNILKDEKDFIYIEKLIDNMDCLSNRWWDNLDSEITKHINQETVEKNEKRINDIKKFAKTKQNSNKDELYLDMAIRKNIKERVG